LYPDRLGAGFAVGFESALNVTCLGFDRAVSGRVAPIEEVLKSASVLLCWPKESVGIRRQAAVKINTKTFMWLTLRKTLVIKYTSVTGPIGPPLKRIPNPQNIEVIQ
jgi:hypothetical protein